MTASRAAALAGSLAVALAVLAGLYLGGSPASQRQVRLDKQRVRHLRNLSEAIKAHWKESERLPASLDELVDGQRLESMPLDPESETEYGFEPVTAVAYRLCANFSMATAPPPDELSEYEP